jgi:hypothetical protein
MTEPERQVLERLAAEGRATTFSGEDVQIANGLVKAGLVFLAPDTQGRDAVSAVITPRGRRLIKDL